MSEIVKGYYNENAIIEWNRLTNPYSNIEFQTTLYMMDKYFKSTGKVLDIGCGPGRYSVELLKKGYDVTLYDISEEELNVAKEKIEEYGLKANEFVCGDCTDLHRFNDNSFDAVLLMGPMYHIQDIKLRGELLKNIKRILKKDGVAIVAYLNGLGIIKAALHECSYEYANLEHVCKLMKNKAWSKEESFTETYVVTPSGAIKEIEDSGLEIISYFGAESFSVGIHSEIKRIADEDIKCYENILELCKQTCEMKEYRDSTEHIHFIVKSTTP
ncbi:methyltransferase domain-containing protein [Romboutsia weinsteinii]|nr:methyltransferase domain-containing protein [Romboutsia weinsteinii]